MTSASTSAPSRAVAPAPPRFRSDIEGLRAVAVIFVLLHHAQQTLLPGGFAGVDVFFVVSGFVITTQLVKEVDRTGRVDLVAFYSRRAKRLLPAATLVLIVTTVAAWLLASRVQWVTISGDIVGSALYVVNWVFAARSVDYLAEDVDPSPVQHFWSLAVEEQFYFIWPVLILGLSVLAVVWRRQAGKTDGGDTSRSTRTVLALGLTVVVVLPSLAWSVWYTASEPQQAYFVTTTRLWELGLGALVAVLAPVWMLLPRVVADALGWVGLTLLLASAVVLDTSVAWPGSAALWPTVATATVIVAGFGAGSWGPVRALGWAPMVWIGGLSYSLYLWHWPLLRMVEWQLGPVSLSQGLAVVVLSVVPAWVGYRLVEHPVRYAPSLRASPRFALSVGANLTLVSVVAGLALWTAANASAPPTSAGTTKEVISNSGDGPLFDVITPDPLRATEDVPELYDQGCQNALDDATVNQCLWGDEDGDVVVAVVGDSKIAQWAPALDAIAKDQGWRVESYTKSGCAMNTALTVVESGDFENCRQWGAAVLEGLEQDPPDAVVVSAVRSSAVDANGEDTAEGLVAGYEDTWGRLIEAGSQVVAISDTPQPGGEKPYECVADNMEDPNVACSWPSKDGSGSAGLRAAAEKVDGATYIDMNRYVCPDGTCPAVYRNVLTYRQGSHITATYVEVLTERLAEELVPLISPS